MKSVFTIVKLASGATENTLADSPVPCPISSFSGWVVPGPSTTGSER